jgi:hypothetical protein
VVLALAGLGCPFDPRDPTPPAGGGGGFCDGSRSPATTPTQLRDRIARALSCRLLDSDYQDSLDEAFTYLPDAVTDALAPGFFAGWNRTRELENLNQALAGPVSTRPVSVTAQILKLERNNLSTDPNLVRFDVQYTIRLVLPDSSEVRYGACADWELSGVNAPPVRLRTWLDLEAFVEPANSSCIPARPILPVRGTSGLMRFERGQ